MELSGAGSVRSGGPANLKILNIGGPQWKAKNGLSLRHSGLSYFAES
jgi:hypothetical protein